MPLPDMQVASGVLTAEAGCVLSVDVEDWFHILDVPSAPPISEWEQLPSCVEKNFRRMLGLFSDAGVHVTCFFLGWVAERYPQLVTEAANAGHEIASHGYGHRLAYEMGRLDFRQDVRRARGILEDLIGAPVLGYRTAGFSATEATPWFFEELAAAGYRYDSSVFPARRGHGGLASARIEPHWLVTNSGDVVEVPITVAETFASRVCFFGGGYLRLFPYALVRLMADSVLRESRPVVFYVHPREIDPRHPRLQMSCYRRFKCYANLHTTETKIRRIVADFRVMTFREYLDACGCSWQQRETQPGQCVA